MASENRLIVSFLTLRWLVGWMGLLLPFVLVLLNWIIFQKDIASSVSAYYHVKYVGAVFVGVMFAFGVFLIAYKGHPPLTTDKPYEISDNFVGNFAGVFAIGVALFPTRPVGYSELESTIGIIHVICAALFLLALAYFAGVLFTKTTPGATRTPKKKQRDMVYRACGVVIFLCVVLIGVNFLIDIAALQALKPVFWLEALAVIAFGISWMIKGQVLLKDPK